MKVAYREWLEKGGLRHLPNLPHLKFTLCIIVIVSLARLLLESEISSSTYQGERGGGMNFYIFANWKLEKVH